MPRSLFMPEMTNLEVRRFLERGGRTVIVPVGSTEDHGDHGPLWTDVYIPTEVAKRAARELEALVAPAVPFGLAHDHRGASGLISLRLSTFVDLLRDVCVSLADAGFRRLVLLNGHYVNTWAMQYAAAQFHDELPAGTRVYPFAYWQGLPPERAEPYVSAAAGIHANMGETAAVLAIDPALVDMDRARDFEPELPELRTGLFTVLDPTFFPTPGSFWKIVEPGGGVWGKPTQATAEKGEQFLEWCADAVVDVVTDVEAMHDLLERGR